MYTDVISRLVGMCNLNFFDSKLQIEITKLTNNYIIYYKKKYS